MSYFPQLVNTRWPTSPDQLRATGWLVARVGRDRVPCPRKQRAAWRQYRRRAPMPPRFGNFCQPVPILAARVIPPVAISLDVFAASRHRIPMPRETGLPPGTLVMLVLKVLATGPLHGYAIAQRIHNLSSEELRVEEGVAVSGPSETTAERLGPGKLDRLGFGSPCALLPRHACGKATTRSRAFRIPPHEPRHRSASGKCMRVRP